MPSGSRMTSSSVCMLLATPMTSLSGLVDTYAHMKSPSQSWVLFSIDSVNSRQRLVNPSSVIPVDSQVTTLQLVQPCRLRVVPCSPFGTASRLMELQSVATSTMDDAKILATAVASTSVFSVSQKRSPVMDNSTTKIPSLLALSPPPPIPTEIITPLNVQAFSLRLKLHPDKRFVMSLLDMLTNGANIGYCGPHYSRSTPNAATARTSSEALSSSIAQEISLFHSVGPFPSPPFPNMVISSLGVRPKKNGKFRIIMDLSRPFFYSVNDYIDRDCYSMQYCRVDDAVNHLCSVGPGAVMAKLDVKHAFRLIPVRSEDWHLLGYQFNDFYYFDIVLPFGLRSSPFLFC